VIAHQQCESPACQGRSGGEHGNTVFEVPVAVVTEVNRYAARNSSLYHAANSVRLVPDDDLERRDPGFTRGFQRANDERFAQKRLEKLGLPRSVLKPIAIPRG
jgi:hypothetical protein